MMNIVEYIRQIPNPKLKEKEAIIFIASFIKICSNSQAPDALYCILSILRFRKVFSSYQMKKICSYIKRISEEVTDDKQNQIFNVLIEEIESMSEDNFGRFKEKQSQEEKSVEKKEEDNDEMKEEQNPDSEESIIQE
jgi:hypothetical protein